ncbi:MAG TPA: hypothetical protein V6D16_12685 [Candidatus Obscuribacterales bacterium]
MHVVIPADLKKEFKAACVMEGVNMSEIVTKLIEDWMAVRKGSKKEHQPTSTDGD